MPWPIIVALGSVLLIVVGVGLYVRLVEGRTRAASGPVNVSPFSDAEIAELIAEADGKLGGDVVPESSRFHWSRNAGILLRVLATLRELKKA